MLILFLTKSEDRYKKNIKDVNKDVEFGSKIERSTCVSSENDEDRQTGTVKCRVVNWLMSTA